jgi:hypothetical protein
MLTSSGSSPSIRLRYFGLFVTPFVIAVSFRSAVAFEDRFGESRDRIWVQYTDSRREDGRMDGGPSGRRSGRDSRAKGPIHAHTMANGFRGPGDETTDRMIAEDPGEGVMTAPAVADEAPGGDGFSVLALAPEIPKTNEPTGNSHVMPRSHHDRSRSHRAVILGRIPRYPPAPTSQGPVRAPLFDTGTRTPKNRHG